MVIMKMRRMRKKMMRLEKESSKRQRFLKNRYKKRQLMLIMSIKKMRTMEMRVKE